MIENTALQNLLATEMDWSLTAEFYSADATPTEDGFSPADAIGLFAAVEGITFQGETYTRLIEKFGNVSTSMTDKRNKASVTFSNVARTAAQFEFSHGFEGLIMVIRLLSRESSIALSDTLILFTGRCDRPLTGDKESLEVMAWQIVGSIDVTVPRRTFGPEDFKGRPASDPEFEGYIHDVEYGSFTFPRQVRGGGFLGLWNTRQERATMQWSSHTDLITNKSVPLCFGRVQIMSVGLAFADVGTQIRGRWAFCEGPIQDLVNVRSTDPQFPLNTTSYVELYGLVGTANGPDDPNWPGAGYYSRTAHIRGQADNSLVDEWEPPPDIVGIVEGLVVTVPDANGVWNTQAWTDNAAAVVRFLLTDENYFNLDENWIDDEYATACYRYNAEEIFNTTASDFIYTEVEQ